MDAAKSRDLPQVNNVVPLQVNPMLTADQNRAMNLLLSGKTITQTAAEIGKSRDTVSRWKNENPHFQAELNRRQAELQDSVNLRLRGLLTKAVAVLEQSLAEGNLKAAVEVMKATGIYGNLPLQDNLIDPEDVVIQQAERIAMRQTFHGTYKGSDKNLPTDFVKDLAEEIAQMLRTKYKVENQELDQLNQDMQEFKNH